MSQATLEAPKPEAVAVRHDGGGLTFSYRWFSPGKILVLLFACVWDGFLGFFYHAALHQHATAQTPMIWFPLIHVAAGIGITYWAIAGLVNRTDVHVADGTITIRIGPLPWAGNRTLNASGIRQLFREETYSRSRNNGMMSYHLSAVLSDNEKVRLIRNVSDADVALYLEQELEKALGIKDQPVPGEMSK